MNGNEKTIKEWLQDRLTVELERRLLQDVENAQVKLPTRQAQPYWRMPKR